MVKKGVIRVVALSICSYQGKILVFHGTDPVTKEQYYRPVGGGIEFGENAKDAVIREFHEEINAKLTQVKYLFTMENIYPFRDRIRHQIMMVFDGILEDKSLYGKSLIVVEDDRYHSQFPASWISLNKFQDQHLTLYPVGLIEKLQDLGY